MDYEREYKRLLEERHYENEERSRREYEAYQRREEERRRVREEAREAECHANSWDEAFRKGIPRYEQEAREEATVNAEIEGTGETPDFFFQQQLEQHIFARTAYQEEMKSIAEQVRKIRADADAAVAHLEQQAREAAAKRVDAHFGTETIIGINLIQDDFESVVNW